MLGRLVLNQHNAIFKVIQKTKLLIEIPHIMFANSLGGGQELTGLLRSKSQQQKAFLSVFLHWPPQSTKASSVYCTTWRTWSVSYMSGRAFSVV